MYQDDIGVWNPLGRINSPSLELWTPFPVLSTTGNALFRVQFYCSNFNRISSFCWIRVNIKTQGTEQAFKPIRLYPTEQKQLIEIPVPKDLELRNVYFRSIEVKKSIRRVRYIGVIPDIRWDISLDEIV